VKKKTSDFLGMDSSKGGDSLELESSPTYDRLRIIRNLLEVNENSMEYEDSEESNEGKLRGFSGQISFNNSNDSGEIDYQGEFSKGLLRLIPQRATPEVLCTPPDTSPSQIKSDVKTGKDEGSGITEIRKGLGMPEAKVVDSSDSNINSGFSSERQRI
jgi:hypothetical protein